MRQKLVQDVHELERHAAGQRSAAERGAVHARTDGLCRAIVCDNHAQGDAAGQRLGRHHDIRQHHRVGKLIGEVLAHAADAALDFIEDQQRIVAVGQFARLADVFDGHREDAALALDQFDDNARGAFVDNLLQRDLVVGRNKARAGEQRLKIAAIFLLAGDGEGAQRASVKRIVQRDDLEFFRIDFVAVRAQPF